MLSPEPDDDARHAEQEGLQPELEELAVEVLEVAVVARTQLGRGLELDPVDRGADFRGLGVPN